MAKVLRERFLGLTLVLIMVFACSGCATLRHPVPMDMVGRTYVDNMAEIRIMRGTVDSELQKSVLRSILEENKDDYPIDSDGKRV